MVCSAPMTNPNRFDRDVEAALAGPGEITVAGGSGGGRSRRYRAHRRREHETKTKDDDAGMGAPWQSDLDIGRGVGHLYWKRLVSEYQKPKEAELRERHSAAALRVKLSVSHAPDAHTPYTYVDWPDPMDVRGATAFAKSLVEDGGAQYSQVVARASRQTSKRGAGDRGVLFTLANFERAED